MLTIKGSLLKFDKLNADGSIVPSDAKIIIPENLPLCFNFHTNEIGIAKVKRSETGLDLVAGYITKAPLLDKDTLETLISSGAGLGGYYNMIGRSKDNSQIVKSCQLRSVSIVLKPVQPELTFEVVEDEND